MESTGLALSLSHVLLPSAPLVEGIPACVARAAGPCAGISLSSKKTKMEEIASNFLNSSYKENREFKTPILKKGDRS
jgi:uncharacterized membrane protein